MKALVLMLSMVVSMTLLGCAQPPKDLEVAGESNQKINALVSILPQKAFVKAVGGEKVKVSALIPPGGSPATYDPKPSDLANVESADIYFRIGHIPFEKAHAHKFSELNKDLRVVDTSKGVELRYFGVQEAHTHEDEGGNVEQDHEDHLNEENNEDDHHAEELQEGMHDEGHQDHDHGYDNAQRSVDPHIWLSVLEVKKQVNTIAQSLSEIDPDNSQFYKDNAKEYISELDNLHAEIQERFAQLHSNKLMVFHPAWGYFARDYGLEQVAIEQDGKEPTAKQLQNVISEAREENVKVIFVQSQFNQDIAKSIAEEIGAVVVSVDPLAEDYIPNLHKISEKLVQHLNKS